MYFRNYGLRKIWLDKRLKSHFRRPFNNQHGKRSQTLLKSARQHLYHIINFTQSTQMQLSNKQKIFSEPFSAIPKSRSNFQHFEKKDDSHSLCISEITDCERRS